MKKLIMIAMMAITTMAFAGKTTATTFDGEAATCERARNNCKLNSTMEVTSGCTCKQNSETKKWTCSLECKKKK